MKAFAPALEALYEAAVTPDVWSGALHQFARATNSIGCRFRPVRWGPCDALLPASPDIGGFLEDFVSEGWLGMDPRTLRGLSLAESGHSVVVEHDIATDEERRRSEFHQTLLRRHDLPWWAALVFTVDGRRWCLSILRNSAQGAFTPADARELAEAAPTLGRVASLAAKLTLVQGQSAIEALAQVGRAALILDYFGHCVAMNALAEAMVSGDLRLTKGRLRALDRQSDRHLQSLIDRAVAPCSSGLPIPSSVFVARREGRRPYIVEALPATGSMRDIFRRIAALVIITDLDARLQTPNVLIRETFGLTPAEVRLAITLGSGEDLRTAAEIQGVAYETARRHLKSIFSKAAVNHQSELVALLTRLSLATTSTSQ
jgi:DNA-binding CsgD family transcriptional regulator